MHQAKAGLSLRLHPCWFLPCSVLFLLLDDDGLDQSGGSGSAQILVYFRELLLGNVCIRRWTHFLKFSQVHS